MSLEKIISISGKPGLFQIVTQTRTGFLVESLLDGKKMSLNLKSNVSLLSEISVYTHGGEIKLAEIFKAISEKENGAQTVSHKEDKSVLEAFFREVLADYDEDRVYASDIKKVVQWYNLLQQKNLLTVTEEVAE